MTRWDFDCSLWDMNSYWGRHSYYSWITNPQLSFVSKDCFEQAKHIRKLYINGKEPANATKEQLLFAKCLYENGFHPDNEEYMQAAGRMSTYAIGTAFTVVPFFLINNLYRPHPGVIVGQFVHQLYNAFVNFTNRNATPPMSDAEKGIGLVAAAATGTAAAIVTKNYYTLRSSPSGQKYVPFFSLAVATCLNIIIVRHNEILKGVTVYDDKGEEAGNSKVAAVMGISEVASARILMIMPAMILLPFIIRRIRQNCWLRRNHWFQAPLAALITSGLLIPLVPLTCALWPQRATISSSTIEHLEPELYKNMKNCMKKIPEEFSFNKGL